MSPTSLDTALEALALAQVEPHRGRAMATDVLALATRQRDVEAASVAERSLGLAARALNEVDVAVVHLRRAVRLADRAGNALLAGEARSSLALALAWAGDANAALREIDRAEAGAHGVEAAALQMQRALVLQRTGRTQEALSWYRLALPVLRRSGDVQREARLLNNRGILLTSIGATAQAERDLTRALALCLQIGQKREAGSALHNLAFVAGRRGDIPTALERYDRAEEAWRDLGLPAGLTLVPRCELLISVRLHSEARTCIEQCVAELERGGAATDLAEARLMLAEVAIAEGDFAAARDAAGLALRGFLRQRRRPWATLARYAALRVDWGSGSRSAATARLAREVAEQLGADGWAIAALDARLISARIALDANRMARATDELAASSAARFRGPVQLRARAWHAEALLRLAKGNRSGAFRAIDAGLARVELHRAALGATELRTRAGGHGEELAALGLQLALDSGRPERVLRWAERRRAGTLRLRPVRQPDMAAQSAELAELRSVSDAIDQAALGGRDTAKLLARQGWLEDGVVRRSRRAAARFDTQTGTQFRLRSLADSLSERAFVELVEHGGRLHAVTVAGGRCRLHPLARSSEVTAELENLRFALRRLAWGTRSGRAVEAAAQGADHAARRLDDMLVRPVADDIGDRELVLVPTGALHALPWSVLPGCAGRPLSVAPSASLWQRADAHRPEEPAGIVLVAGPDLPGAAAEVRSLAALYPSATVLAGPDATATRVTALISGVGLLHLAAHGTFRADNPLFSSLRLSGGPLNVYDFEGLTRPPQRIVLAACDSGLSQVHPGDELLGLVSVCLGLGTRSLVACVMPVPDEQASTLMLALHAEISRGVPVARALAAASAGLPDEGDGHGLAARAAFVCFGAG